MLNSLLPTPTPRHYPLPVRDEAYRGPNHDSYYHRGPAHIQPFDRYQLLQSFFQLMAAWSSFMGGQNHNHHAHNPNPYQTGPDVRHFPSEEGRFFSTPPAPPLNGRW